MLPAWTSARPAGRPELLEIAVESDRDWPEPLWDVTVAAVLTGPSGGPTRREAFWDGGRVWRLRFRPPQAGPWRWRIESDDPSLDGRTGTCEVEPASTFTRFDRHGSVRIGADGRSFEHEDGHEFFWLGDTVWNAPFRSTAADWAAYLDYRAGQDFTVVQVFTLPWRGHPTDAEGRRGGEVTDGRVAVDPAYFRRLDDRIRAANDRGFLLSAIVLLALRDEDAGRAWPEESIARYTRWLRARWAGSEIAWTFGADGDFRGSRADRWRRLGPRVFADPDEPLVTMHPCGQNSCAEEFRDAAWMTFHVYQSGHAGDPATHRWLVQGPYAQEVDKAPIRPIVNAEPNYEDHPRVRAGGRFTPADVRRAAYWSLFVSGVAGIAYGQYSLWAWSPTPELVGSAIAALASDHTEPWRTVLQSAGAHDMTRLRRLLESGPWRDLRPAAAVLAEQPGDADVDRFQAAARIADAGWTLVYVPEPGGVVALAADSEPATARWFDPSTGRWHVARTADGRTFATPTAGDWVLDLRRG